MERKLNIREARKEKAKLKERLLARFKKDFLGVQDTSRDMHYNRSSVQVSLLVNQRKEEQFQRTQSRRKSATKIPVENTSQSDTALEEADDKSQNSKLKLSPTLSQESGLDTHNEQDEDMNNKSEEENVEINQEIPKTVLHIIDEQQTEPQPDNTKHDETVLPVVKTEHQKTDIQKNAQGNGKRQEPLVENTDTITINDDSSSDDIENIKSEQNSSDTSGSVRKRNSNDTSARSSPSRSHKVHPID